MSDTPDPGEARRRERILALMEKDRAAEGEAVRVEALLGGTFEACVTGLTAPADRATVLATDAGLVLLQYADPEQSLYWVPLAHVQWLKVVTAPRHDV